MDTGGDSGLVGVHSTRKKWTLNHTLRANVYRGYDLDSPGVSLSLAATSILSVRQAIMCRMTYHRDVALRSATRFGESCPGHSHQPHPPRQYGLQRQPDPAP